MTTRLARLNQSSPDGSLADCANGRRPKAGVGGRRRKARAREARTCRRLTSGPPAPARPRPREPTQRRSRQRVPMPRRCGVGVSWEREIRRGVHGDSGTSRLELNRHRFGLATGFLSGRHACGTARLENRVSLWRRRLDARRIVAGGDDRRRGRRRSGEGRHVDRRDRIPVGRSTAWRRR